MIDKEIDNEDLDDLPISEHSNRIISLEDDEEGSSNME
jgi:hypothetical protein